MSETDSAAIAQLYERLERFEANTNRTLASQTVLLEEVYGYSAMPMAASYAMVVLVYEEISRLCDPLTNSLYFSGLHKRYKILA